MPQNEEVVQTYFELIQGLRTGVEGTVEKLTDLWDPDGVFEFAGSPPVTGTFVGRNAITVLYTNRFAASGMPLQLQGSANAADKESEGLDTALGVVQTDVHRVRALDDDRVVAGWTTVIGTADRQGFQVSGSHSFTLKDGRITHLRVVVSPKPDDVAGFDREALSVDDIGRLSLAAWAVV